MSSNPFEPPRTTDLDGDSPRAPGSLVVSPDAVGELAAAAPWVRALARFTKANLAIQAIGMIGDLSRADSAATTALMVLLNGGQITMTTLLLIALRRYATASVRLREASAAAVGPIISAQASYLKLCGILAAIAAALFIFGIAVGVGSGRFLAWIYK